MARVPDMPAAPQAANSRFVSGLAGATGQRSLLIPPPPDHQAPPPLPREDYPGAQHDRQARGRQSGGASGGGETSLMRMARELAADLNTAGSDAGARPRPASAPPGGAPSSGNVSRNMQGRRHSCGTPILDSAQSMLPSMSGQAMSFSPSTLIPYGKTIGNGAFGVAHRASMGAMPGTTDRLGRKLLSPIFVVKDNRQSPPEAVAREVRCMTAAGAFGFTPSDNPTRIVMKDGGATLQSLLDSDPIKDANGRIFDRLLPESQQRSIGKQVLTHLERVHASGVAHLDLKTDNIVINGNGNVSLIDYGCAAEPCRTRNGVNEYQVNFFALHYAAPEMLKDGPVTNKADVWAAGLVLLEMAVGPGGRPALYSHDHRFDTRRHRQLMEDIKHNSRIPGDLKQVLLASLTYEPENRPSAAQLLKYPYFQPRKASEMGAMELSVAHAKAFRELAEAERAMEQASSDRSLNQVAAAGIFKNLVECRARVKELQAALAKFGSSTESASVLRRPYQPRWSR